MFCHYAGFRLSVQPVQDAACALGLNASACLSSVQVDWPQEHVFPVFFSSNRPEAASVTNPRVTVHGGAQTTAVVFSLLAAVPMALLVIYGCLS